MVKFVFIESESAVEVYWRSLKPLVQKTSSKAAVPRWCNDFKNGNWDVEDHSPTSEAEEGIVVIMVASN